MPLSGSLCLVGMLYCDDRAGGVQVRICLWDFGGGLGFQMLPGYALWAIVTQFFWVCSRWGIRLGVRFTWRGLWFIFSDGICVFCGRWLGLLDWMKIPVFQQ